MTTISEQVRARSGIPDLYGRIPGGGGDTTAVRRPGDSPDCSGMASQFEEDAARSYFSYLYQATCITGDDALAIGRP